MQVKGKFDLFSQLEVSRAIGGLAGGKAPGPDMLPVEIFRHSPCLLRPLTDLFNCIVGRGRFPARLARLYIVPLDKPNKEAHLCKSKRPISLICVVAKILEAIALHRLMRELEATLDPCQYAYRRERGSSTGVLHAVCIQEYAYSMHTGVLHRLIQDAVPPPPGLRLYL